MRSVASTYTKETKTELLGVSPELLRQRGAVCADVAIAMAGSALRRSPANIAVAITGVAGRKPDDDHNPVGFVCIAAPVKVVLRGTPSGPTARSAAPRFQTKPWWMASPKLLASSTASGTDIGWARCRALQLCERDAGTNP